MRSFTVIVGAQNVSFALLSGRSRIDGHAPESGRRVVILNGELHAVAVGKIARSAEGRSSAKRFRELDRIVEPGLGIDKREAHR